MNTGKRQCETPEGERVVAGGFQSLRRGIGILPVFKRLFQDQSNEESSVFVLGGSKVYFSKVVSWDNLRSRRVRERIDRAKEHRLLLLSLKVVERGEISAAVVGHTGNVYDVRIGQRGGAGARVLCTCLDFVKARSACKHLLFLFLRVFQLPDDDPRLWQRALLAQELSELRKRLEKVSEVAAEVQAPEHAWSLSCCRGKAA
eukprot:s952_g5.t1